MGEGLKRLSHSVYRNLLEEIVNAVFDGDRAVIFISQQYLRRINFVAVEING